MDKKLARLLGAAATLSTMTAAQAGPRAGAPRGYQLSQPSRPDPERPAAAESRRATSGAEWHHQDRSGRNRTPSSPSPSSWRSCLCPRRTASPSPPSSPSSSPPSSRVVISREGHPFGCPSRMRASGGNAASVKAPRDGYARWAIEPAGLPGDILRQATSERAEPLNQISDQRDRGAPSHRQA